MANKNIRQLKITPIYLWRPVILLPLLVFILILVTYLIYNNYTVDQANRLRNLALEEDKLKSELSLKYGQVKSVPLFINKMKDLGQLESQVSQRFPNTEELSLVLIQINQVAEDTNVNITNFSPKNLNKVELVGGNKTGNIMTETYNLNLNANYIDFVNFIFQLSKLARLTEVTNVNMARVDDNKINVNLDIKIFYSRK